MYSTDNVDWDTMSYIGEKTQVYTIKINISEDGGNTWTTLDDFAQRPGFLAMGFEEAMYYDNSLAPQIIDLSDYAGKDVKIGFEYVGTDGQLQSIDCVSVGYPALNAAYYYPFETLCFGIDPNFTQWALDVAMLPVYSPLTWMNASDGNPDNTTYTWSYMAADNSQLTSTDEKLTETYRTDYTSEFTTRNNMYTAPVLRAEAPNAAPGEFSLYNYFQTGGKPEASLKDEQGNAALYNLGLTTFASSEGLSFATGGEDSSPIFGYDANVDKFWTDYRSLKSLRRLRTLQGADSLCAGPESQPGVLVLRASFCLRGVGLRSGVSGGRRVAAGAGLTSFFGGGFGGLGIFL